MDLKGPQKVAPEAPETPKMAIFGAFGALVPFYGGPKFGPISIKIGQIVRITKKMTLNKCGPGSGPNYGETAVCSLDREGKNGRKSVFRYINTPKTVIPR